MVDLGKTIYFIRIAIAILALLVLLLAGCIQPGIRTDSKAEPRDIAHNAVSADNSQSTSGKQSAVNNLGNIYIGCLHSAHTLYSDGSLEYPGEFYSSFKPYWDWIATTSHASDISAAEWQSLMENARAQNSDKFVSFLGYEWTSSTWGHFSVVFRGDPVISGPTRSTDPAYDTPKKLYSFLSSEDGLAGFAHPALPGLQIDFNRDSDYRNDEIACLVGIFGYADRSHWNSAWDYAGGRSIPAARADKANSGGWIKTALDRGYKLGFVSELDLHDKVINPISYRYTGVLSDNLSRDSIFRALKSRHTYAVRSPSGLGKRINLKSSTGNHIMGDIFTSKTNEITVLLQGKTDLDKFNLINLFLNGKIVEDRSVTSTNLAEDFKVKLSPGANYIFFEVRALAAEGQESQAFTSPLYVHFE